MNQKNGISPLVTLLIVVTSTLIMLLAIRSMREILSPIILATLLTITITPLTNWFTRKGVPTKLSVTLTLAIISLIVIGFIVLTSYAVISFTGTIQIYSSRFDEISAQLDRLLSQFGWSLTEASTINAAMTPEGLIWLIATFMREFYENASNWALILVITIIFLRETVNMPQKVKKIVRDGNADIQRFVHFNHEVRSYMSITAGWGFIASALEVLLLMMLNVEFALMWGVFSFIMSFVPQIGLYIALIPPTLMAFIQFGLGEALVVLAGFLIIDGVINRSIKRKYYQRKLNVSIPAIFVSVTLWYWVLGPFGAILAVPMAMLVQALLASREETAWMAYLMSGGQQLFTPESVPELATDSAENSESAE
jgi:predicted PurR-regulated permease PerM